MKVVVAGGTGFIGRHIVRELMAHGHAVTVLSRKSGSDPRTGAPLAQWDGVNAGPWESSINGADAVMNLAGESVGSRWTNHHKANIIGSRVNATRALVRAIEKASSKPRVLVNASAVHYYGHVADGEVPETTPPADDFLGRTCVQWESEAKKAEALGVRVAILRTGFVLARDADAFKRLKLPFLLFAGGPFGPGTQWFAWIHIDDVVAGYLFAAENENLSGPANLSSPNPVRVRQLATTIGKALHRPAFFPAPSFALKIVLGEMSDLLLKGQRVIPARLRELGFSFRFPDLSEALADVTRPAE